MSALPATRTESLPRTRLPRDLVRTAVIGGGLIVLIVGYSVAADPGSVVSQTVSAISSLGFLIFGTVACARGALRRNAYEGMLARLGYQVNIVANGVQALDALSSTTYSAVLMDCHMPIMDGFDATQEIRRRQDQNSAIPIIAMTAGAMVEDRARCLDAGMDDYVSKPIDLKALGELLRKWVPDKPAPAETREPPCPSAATAEFQAAIGPPAAGTTAPVSDRP